MEITPNYFRRIIGALFYITFCGDACIEIVLTGTAFSDEMKEQMLFLFIWCLMNHCIVSRDRCLGHKRKIAFL